MHGAGEMPTGPCPDEVLSPQQPVGSAATASPGYRCRCEWRAALQPSPSIAPLATPALAWCVLSLQAWSALSPRACNPTR